MKLPRSVSTFLARFGPASEQPPAPGIHFDPGKHPRKLNLGCGPDHRIGYVNVDMNGWYKPDLIADVRRLEFLPASYYNEIVAQDVLEHLPRVATLSTLAGWNRLLRPGGRLLLRVPSILGIAEQLKSDANSPVTAQEELIQCLFGTQAYTGDFHYTGFTETVLRHYLQQTGFAVTGISVLQGCNFDVVSEKVGHPEVSPLDDYSHLLEVDAHAEFVERCFREILGREVDDGGKSFFLDGLARGMGRHEVIQVMLASPEYLARRKPPSEPSPDAAQPLPAAQPQESAPVADGATNLLYDQQTAEIIRTVVGKDSSCVDVGCHEGSILDLMLQQAPQGRHFAFEPIPDLFAGLERKYSRLENVSLYDLALSDAPGETTFQHVVSNPAYSGLLRRRFDRPHEDVVEIRVRVARLDDILPADADIGLVKIDVEGAELQVLRGARATLQRCKPFVVFEHGQGASEVYGTRPEHVHDFFTGLEMRISVLGDWLATRGARTLSREEFVQQYERVTNYYFLAHR